MERITQKKFIYQAIQNFYQAACFMLPEQVSAFAERALSAKKSHNSQKEWHFSQKEWHLRMKEWHLRMKEWRLRVKEWQKSVLESCPEIDKWEPRTAV